MQLVDGAKIVLIMRQLIEGILVVGGVYVLLGKALEKKVVYAGMIQGIIINIVRALPVSFGIHTIVSLIITIFMINKITNISIMKSITNIITVFVVLTFCDWISLIVYTNLFNMKIEELLNGSVESSLYGMGPLVIMLIFLFAVKYIKGNKKIWA